MILRWFDARNATKIGAELADRFAPRKGNDEQATRRKPDDELDALFRIADTEVRGLQLNVYKKAKFANSFKWRLLENGVESILADEVTQKLVMHLSGIHSAASTSHNVESEPADRPQTKRAKQLLALGNKSIQRGDYSEAIGYYQDVVKSAPRNVAAVNNIGAALSKLGRYQEAEKSFLKAIQLDPGFSDAYGNVGVSMLIKGDYSLAESYFRRALKLNPRFLNARINLGLALIYLGRLPEAKSQLEKALKEEPRNPDALHGVSLIAKTEGRFEEAETLLSRVLQLNPRLPRALAAQAGMHKMSLSDKAWLERAQDVAESGVEAADESELRFAIGKYYDDIREFKHAFNSYSRANELLKASADPYDRDAHRHLVDRLIRVYSSDSVARIGGVSESRLPVFVVGMPRSGTSLTEQIIASHPSAHGAGELAFWSRAAHEHEAALREGALSESTRTKLAQDYLRLLETKSGQALRVVDKAPVNSDHLGLIHSVFPNARVIYMQRDPIDTCLSCYFQKFVLSMNFTFALSDLANYYRQHQRLMAHWRTALPRGTILDVPYESLVGDQVGWTRKILAFLNLEWDQRVLDFQDTKRSVVTASFWQVRQKVYTDSVRRWRNYEKFIGPLLDLKDLAH